MSDSGVSDSDPEQFYDPEQGSPLQEVGEDRKGAQSSAAPKRGVLRQKKSKKKGYAVLAEDEVNAVDPGENVDENVGQDYGPGYAEVERGSDHEDGSVGADAGADVVQEVSIDVPNMARTTDTGTSAEIEDGRPVVVQGTVVEGMGLSGAHGMAASSDPSLQPLDYSKGGVFPAPNKIVVDESSEEEFEVEVTATQMPYNDRAGAAGSNRAAASGDNPTEDEVVRHGALSLGAILRRAMQEDEANPNVASTSISRENLEAEINRSSGFMVLISAVGWFFGVLRFIGGFFFIGLAEMTFNYFGLYGAKNRDRGLVLVYVFYLLIRFLFSTLPLLSVSMSTPAFLIQFFFVILNFIVFNFAVRFHNLIALADLIDRGELDPNHVPSTMV